MLKLEVRTVEEHLFFVAPRPGQLPWFAAFLNWNDGEYWLQAFTNQELQDNESTCRGAPLDRKPDRTIFWQGDQGAGLRLGG